MSTGAAHNLKIPQRAFQEALARWAHADYRSVMLLLEDMFDTQSRLLLAKSHIRLRDFISVQRVLSTVVSTRAPEMLEVDVLRAYATDRLAGVAEDFDASPIGKLVLERRADPKSHGISAYYQAVALFMRGNFDDALDVAIGVSAAPATPMLNAWAYELLGWIQVSRQDFESALLYFRKTIELLDTTPAVDNHKLRNALHGYGMLAVEMIDLQNLESFLAYASDAKRLPEQGRLDSLVFTNVALGHAILGNENRALIALMEAAGAAPSGPFKALPNIELSALFTRHGSTAAAQMHLQVAQNELDGTEWGNQDDEATSVLLDFASEAAANDVAMASRYFARALNLTGKKDPTLAFERNGRVYASAIFARGKIAHAKGDSESARADISEAQMLWLSLGYTYRALIAEIERVKVDGSHTKTSPLLLTALRQIPRSWIATSLKSARGYASNPIHLISPAERKVVDGICEGLTSKQIAERLGRSPSTIRNQTTSVYRQLGVNTRAGLVALTMLSEQAPRGSKANR